MDWFSGEILSALLMIIVIDLVLAGDNAIVIGMAARNLPAHQQKKAIIWGTVGAVVIRAAATLAVVWLLKIPGLLLVGGLFLIWITLKLLTDEKDHDNVKAGATLGAAIRTIVIADAVMGIDNILAVAGAAHGHFVLVVIGLAISVPVMVWGSTLVLKLIERYPATLLIGAAVLALTSAKMIVTEGFIKDVVGTGTLKWTIVVISVVIIMGVGMAIKKSKEKKRAALQTGGQEPFKAS